jgi:nucleotide-binding universal stress UspA family protein
MPGKILLATRYGSESDAPARIAARLVRDLRGTLSIVYVAMELETVAIVATAAGLDEDDLRASMRAKIEAQVVAFMAEHLPGEQIEVLVVEGEVVEAIVRATQQTGARFLVVGAHSRSGIRRLVLGDTTRAILQRSQCPVVVVPMDVEHAPEESEQA